MAFEWICLGRRCPSPTFFPEGRAGGPRSLVFLSLRSCLPHSHPLAQGSESDVIGVTGASDRQVAPAGVSCYGSRGRLPSGRVLLPPVSEQTACSSVSSKQRSRGMERPLMAPDMDSDGFMGGMRGEPQKWTRAGILIFFSLED